MKNFIAFVIFCLISLSAISQIVHSDTTKNWYIPTHASIQYAGGFGFLSAGAGYDFFKDRLSVDIMFGYLPKSIGGISIFSLNTKTVYKPWHININNVPITIVPINIGLLTMHAFGEQYTKFKKSGDYPQGYYWWPNSTRVGISIGQNYFYKLQDGNLVNTLEVYWDVSADDLGMYSNFENKVVERKHIYTFDLGMRCYF